MRNALALFPPEMDEIYRKLNNCPESIDLRFELADKYVPNMGIERRLFWEDFIVMAAEGLSDN